MLVVNRFRVPESEGEQFRAELDRAIEVLAEQTGFEEARTGCNVDDPQLWVLLTRWRNIGSYRRALSAYDVKIGVVPLLGRALDEPSAYETETGELNRNIPR